MNLAGSNLTGTFTLAGKSGTAKIEFTDAGATQVSFLHWSPLPAAWTLWWSYGVVINIVTFGL